MSDDEELDSLDPAYDGVKGRYYLRSIFGAEFCHEMMADFDLPTCHDEINWDDEKSRARWLHFCVAFIPVYLAEGAEMVKEFPEHAEGHALMCRYYEAAQVGLREAMRREDPDLFALYHPGDAMPEWMRDAEEPEALEPDSGGINALEGMNTWIDDAQKWNLPDANGEYEWRLGCPFWPNFHHSEMPSYGLPPSYAQINWRDARQTRAWLRFCVWFFPIVLLKAQRPDNPLPTLLFVSSVENFNGVARMLDDYIPREEGEDALFET